MFFLPQKEIAKFIQDAFEKYDPILKESTEFYVAMSERILKQKQSNIKKNLFVWVTSGNKQIYGTDVIKQYLDNEYKQTNVVFFKEMLTIACESFDEELALKANRLIFHAITSPILRKSLFDNGYNIAKTTQEAGITIVDNIQEKLIFRLIITIPISYSTRQEEVVDYFNDFTFNVIEEQ